MPYKDKEKRRLAQQAYRAKPEIKEKAREQSKKSDAKRRHENPARFMVKRARNRAKKAGYKSDLTVEYIRSIMPKYCPLLGIPLNLSTGTGAAGPNSPSLDKIYPDKKYMQGNVMVISNLANTIKSNATPQQLIAVARNLKYIVDELYPYGPHALQDLNIPLYQPALQSVPAVPVGVPVEEGAVTIEPVPVVGEVLTPYLHVVENKTGKLEHIHMEVTITDTNPASYTITYPTVVPPPPAEVAITCTPSNKNPSALNSYRGEVYISPQLELFPLLDKPVQQQTNSQLQSK